MRKMCLFALLILFSCSKDEPPRYLLSVSASIGGTVNTTGGDYSEGKSVTITATANAEYQFVNWSNGSTQNPLTVTVMSDQVLTANFIKVKYNLLLSTKGEGTIVQELISSGRTEYNSGSVVRLTAVPAVGYSFTGWTEDITSTSNPLEVDITSAKTIKAVFDLIVVNLQIELEGEGEVLQEVVGADRSTNYNYGDTIKLTAQPVEGFDFISWSGDIGDLDPKQNPLEITLTESRTIKANFDYELFNRVVGKWKIRKKTQDKLFMLIGLNIITFDDDYSFTLDYSLGQVNGMFDVLSNSSISLFTVDSFFEPTSFGMITDPLFTDGEIVSDQGESNIEMSFDISIPGVIETSVESDSDVYYEEDKTYVPDDNFEQTLINLGYDDQMDDYVNTSNITTVQELKNGDWAGTITDLTGIEDFISLTDLQADNMELSQLDVSNNIYLKNLSVHSNNLTELDLENNTILSQLIIYDNNLTSIDLKTNILLDNLNLGNNSYSNNNQISSLDLSSNTLLYNLNLGALGLTSIDLSNNPKVNRLFLAGNPLTSINISSLVDINSLILNHTQITSIDLTKNTSLKSLYLQYNNLIFIDLSYLSELNYLNIDANQLSLLDVSNNSLLTGLSTKENSNLSCIKVNSDQLENIPSDWEKDESTEYSLDCLVSCNLSVILTSGSANQTLTSGSAITNNQYTLSDNCSVDVTYEVVVTGLPLGVNTALSNNVVTISGTPTSTSGLVSGTYNYTLTLSGGTSSSTLVNSTITSGTITVSAPAIYLSTNGVTVKCTEANVGDTATIGDKEYTVLDEAGLRTMIANDEDVTCACTSYVTNMKELFKDKTEFNQNISSWDTSSVTDMMNMFLYATAFNQDIGSWDTSNVTRMRQMFQRAISFNQNIGNWDTSSVNDMLQMFWGWEQNSTEGMGFNQDISNWNTSNVTNMRGMFRSAFAFNQDIGNWDTSKVTDMAFMFLAANSFNQNIGNWNTSNVTNINGMFNSASVFNQDIGNWNTSNVVIMNYMFFMATAFDQNISSWNTTSVNDMGYMFSNALAFNQNIGSWNTSNVTDMSFMFYNAAEFNQDLTDWCVSNITSEPNNFATNSLLTTAKKPVWGTCPSSFSLNVTASSSSDYTLSGTDRNGNISGSDPNLTFSVGDTISFDVSASGHPFYLKTTAGTGTGNTISGVTNNGTESGAITWTPTETGTFYYQCSLHGGMVGTITIQ